jgi:type II secretory pathway component PulK
LRRSRRSGAALIITLGVLAGLVAILVATFSTQQVTLQAIGNRTQARRARLVADAGIQRALSTLATQDINNMTPNDEWLTLGNKGDDNFVVGTGSFRMEILDASGLINLNTATQQQLEKLPLTAEQIDSLLDWREASTTPRQEGGKDEYYNNLDTPYNAKLRRIDTLDELLLVKGFTAKTIFEPQTDVVSTATTLPNKADGTQPTLYDLSTVDSTSGNTTSGGQAKPNISTVNNPQQLVQYGLTLQQAQALINARPTTYAAMLRLIPSPQAQRNIVNAYGVSNGQTLTGKINVNTATEAVLDTVPNLPPDVATSIVSRQSTGFTQLGDLFDIPGFTGQVAQQTLDYFNTNSRTFVVRIVGTAGTVHVSLEALVSATGTTARVLKVTQLPFADMTTRWGWNPETTSETVLKEAAQQ